MTMPPLPLGLVTTDTSEEVRNEVILEVMKSEAERLTRFPKIYPHLNISPGIAAKPQERLQRIMTKIVDAYTVATTPDGQPLPQPYFDSLGAEEELQWLLNPDYLELILAGMAPPPRSRPWINLLPIRFVFRELARTFRADFAAWEKRQEQR